MGLVPPAAEVMAFRGSVVSTLEGRHPAHRAVLGGRTTQSFLGHDLLTLIWIVGSVGPLNEVVFFDGQPSHHGVAMRAPAGRADSLTSRGPAPGTGPTVDPGSEQRGGDA